MSIRFCIGLRWTEDEPVVEYDCDSFEDALEEWHRLARAPGKPMWLRLFYRTDKTHPEDAGDNTHYARDDKDVSVLTYRDALHLRGGPGDMGDRDPKLAGGSR